MRKVVVPFCVLGQLWNDLKAQIFEAIGGAVAIEGEISENAEAEVEKVEGDKAEDGEMAEHDDSLLAQPLSQPRGGWGRLLARWHARWP